MAFPLVLFLQVAAAVAASPARSVGLRTAAEASIRPRECAPSRAHAGGLNNVWDAARDPQLGRYCDFLARGFSQLAFSPKEALESADAAERCSPGRAAPAVLRGRALTNLKAFDRAAVELDRARSIDSRSLEEPLTLRDWARALARTGHSVEALAAYRSLGPRLSLLPSPEERAHIFVEAAELALSLDAGSLDDGLAFLGEARQLGVRDLVFRIGSELALAMDRKGRQEEAFALAGELARDAHKWSAARPGADDPAEAQAAWALVLERVDLREARATWERYLRSVGEGAPWAAHARGRLERLHRGDVAR